MVTPSFFIKKPAVGAFRPDMCELPPALCHAASASGRLLADTLFGIEDEAGDLLQAGIDWATVQPFETAILQADAIRARAGSPLVFKSVGYALWDLAACVLASRQNSRRYAVADASHIRNSSRAGSR